MYSGKSGKIRDTMKDAVVAGMIKVWELLDKPRKYR